MQSIINTCAPRDDILTGTFNPEIFTASLTEVIRFYQTDQQGIHSVYTDAVQFFNEATYATDGFKMVLNEVFARLAGDGSVPAIHRLETAFGGGKTHTLIACTHIGYKGKNLSGSISSLIDPGWIPEEGEVDVVGIAGNEISVHKPHGTELVPYTLWGEIAYQIGGESLYHEVGTDAGSYAAPGKNYFDTVFKDRKVLLMIDELAQYAARLSAAKADGSEQLAAFLMSLHEYARSSYGISIVLTLAGATDAFSRETSKLTDLLSRITGTDMNADDALGIGQKAIDSITSVVSRDAISVVPVQASEISSVLAKRLFRNIDETAAKETVYHYKEMYRKNTLLLPDQAVREDFYDRMVSHYPFHPSFIDFLNHKLATYENFQGTRGVLRILALAVRTLWKKQANIPMIHTCHLDLRDARTINEVIGRSGSNDLLSVLNADVGGADTDSLSGGRSNAELADMKNPHPEGWPLYEYTWKTVFLHSLVGRDQELGSSIFGLSEQDALFEVSFPGVTPPQVTEALQEISNSAFYLRFNKGRYYASLEPSVNRALERLRRGLRQSAVDDLLDAYARKVVSSGISPFTIVSDVSAPEHIPDKKGKPSLALISLKADPVHVEEFVTTAGPNLPRIEQNLVFVLVPNTVEIKKAQKQGEPEFETPSASKQENQGRLNDLARTVLAMRELKKNPHNHGIAPEKLEAEDFSKRHSERENALLSSVTESFRNLWYPSASGRLVCKEIRTAGGEGGTPLMEQIRKVLLDDNELITASHTDASSLANLKSLIFARQDTAEISKIEENFCRIRRWPILESPDVLEQIIRTGVNKGQWCLFRMGAEENTEPAEFHSLETGELPFHIDIKQGYSLVTPEGARQRGWGKQKGPEKHQVQDRLLEEVRDTGIETVWELSDKITSKYGEIPSDDFNEAVSKMIQSNRVYACRGEDVEENEKPDVIRGANAALYMPEEEDVLVTPSKASEKGWVTVEDNSIRFSGKEGARKLMPLLRQIGSLYEKGAKSRIDVLDLTDIELPGGGRLRIAVEDAPAESMKSLGELFEIIHDIAGRGDRTECHLTVNHPEENCPFMKEIKKD